MTDTGYLATRDLFAQAGIRFPDLAVVTSQDELLSAVREGKPAFPVVLKAMGLLHKSDAGGVILNLKTEEDLLAAYQDLVNRLNPPAVTVEAMSDLSLGVEVIVGSQQDPRFGPVVLVGLGGVFAEVLADVAFALAPLSVETAKSLLLSLRGAPLLTGARGRQPVDLEALARAVVAVSEVAASHPEISELEVNPILATAGGCVALDARAILAGSEPAH